MQTMQYALVDNINTVIEYREHQAQPPNMPSKQWRWLPVNEISPPFDQATDIRTGPVIAVSPTEVTRTFTVRAKTSAELNAEKIQRATAAEAGITNSPILRAIVLQMAADKGITPAAMLTLLRARID